MTTAGILWSTGDLTPWEPPGKGAAVVVFFWSAQHLVIPYFPDGTDLVSRLIGALLITLSDATTAILAACAVNR
ncbi:hypothetical protein [Arthrobacter sp. ISL-69]|uniref:hypothetical protein n=1 Tax=Arthrobacter sp. ISL-69 TaxID=2819113 RepID=UPI001BEA5763|nr:hypothetical protein [Arthrobacter sp. ISL-69]MBT2539114.1 hypothetical protein [Arthrobacter sp. ISL-69]